MAATEVNLHDMPIETGLVLAEATLDVFKLMTFVFMMMGAREFFLAHVVAFGRTLRMPHNDNKQYAAATLIMLEQAEKDENQDLPLIFMERWIEDRCINQKTKIRGKGIKS